MTGSDADFENETQHVELYYAACNDCDWYELTGEDDVYADNLAYEHQNVYNHESYLGSTEVKL